MRWSSAAALPILLTSKRRSRAWRCKASPLCCPETAPRSSVNQHGLRAPGTEVIRGRSGRTAALGSRGTVSIIACARRAFYFRRTMEAQMVVREQITTVISAKGQVTLPKAIRDQRCWPVGTRLTVDDAPDGVFLKALLAFPLTAIAEVFGSMRRAARSAVARRNGSRNRAGSQAPSSRLTPTS